MAIITRRISNLKNYQFTIPCPGENNNQNANLVIPASVVDLDLLTLTTEDNLWTLQPQLLSLQRVGAISVTGTIDTASFDYNGVSSIHADSSPSISGDIHFVSGANVTLTQVGQDITIASTGGGGGASFIYNEIPVGPVNSSNPTFTLAHTPIVGTVQLFRNGILQNPNSSVDYSVIGNTITFTVAPLSGNTLLAHYQY